MMKLKVLWLIPILALALLAPVRAQVAEIDVVHTVALDKLIPLHVSGYSGEVDRILKYDLEIAGFRLTDAEAAKYLLAGKNTDQVEGRLADSNKTPMLAKAYSGGSLRTQAHSLADDVVQAILGKPGIARTKIVFKCDTGPHSEIYICDYDGGNPVAVTRDDNIVAAPTWSPGRRMLYYTSYKSGYPDIYSHDLTTGERRAFAHFSGLNTSAAVSPDGRRVAMILSKSGSPDLYVCDADGRNLLQLTHTREDESSPCWSPDGTKICFAGRVNERRGLYVVPSTGGTMNRIRTDGVSSPSEPDWSPDGKTIIFTSQMRDFNLCTVPATGGIATVITEGEDPSWAPNSRTVVFTRRVKNRRVLSLLDVPSKRVKDTALNLGNCSQPSWAK